MSIQQNYRLVFIEWIDSKGITSQWEYLDEIESIKPTICYSVGFILEETEQYTTIAQSISATQVLGRTTIPHCSVKKKVELKA